MTLGILIGGILVISVACAFLMNFIDDTKNKD